MQNTDHNENMKNIILKRTTIESKKEPPYDDIENTRSGNIWKNIPGGHKWLDYFKIYDKEFSRFVNTKPRVLEIGVYRGASLRLWKNFFGEGSFILGIDLNEQCLKHQSPDENIFVEIGDQSNQDFLKDIINRYGPFDIIIDDGSHMASHQIISFMSLFYEGLKVGGIYLVEDLECMYWGSTNTYRDLPSTSVDFFKKLIDFQNEVFSRYSCNDLSINSEDFKNQVDVINISKFLYSVTFYQGVVAIEKEEKNPPRVLHI
ncbi:class I SAM-dependent methyltransferase [Gluconacetobacter asukensis]|uniref:Methyltransferase domain-containing protein n=1 Tax=Gluconacetobacter asukensis TaxID=1017181 RepID=A0A7W4NYS3_9PROT|nr:class I SAM-dependent methyltransferase [Gluconacetobacter asukensis]MBB2171281.1 hypothetical protein [Gluconacetobacter asukensis]